MKTLLLLRHAKSSWKDSTLPDHDRPLNTRGRHAAALVRTFLQKKKQQPEFVLSSSSLRTRQTVEIIFEGATIPPEICFDDALYLASAPKLIEIVSALGKDCDQILIVGHNPGTEQLSYRLTGVEKRFPTATLAGIALSIESWSEVGNTKGKLLWLVTPSQLESSE
jgi:phosphohistidine phosphatase